METHEDETTPSGRILLSIGSQSERIKTKEMAHKKDPCDVIVTELQC